MGRTTAKKDGVLARELAAVRAAAQDPRAPGSAERLRDALSSSRSHVVAAAAHVIEERGLAGFESALAEAWARWLEGPAKADPGCHAKLSLLEALDHTESMEREPFLAGARVVQIEAAWGGPVDTAAGVRARAAVALARTGFDDTVVLMGEMLGDPAAQVRSAAAMALAHFGDRHGAAPLLLKLARPDADPLVTLECMSALLSLAPDHGMRRLTPLLTADDTEERELAALALGQSGRPEAADALIGCLRECVLAKQREVLLRALGLHRSDRAAEVLLEIIGSPNATDAEAALTALAPRRFEASIRARAEAAVGDRARLRRTFLEAFSDAGPR